MTPAFAPRRSGQCRQHLAILPKPCLRTFAEPEEDPDYMEVQVRANGTLQWLIYRTSIRQALCTQTTQTCTATTITQFRAPIPSRRYNNYCPLGHISLCLRQ